MGIKEIENKMEIVSKIEAENLDKNTNVTVISELNDNKYLIRYSGKITDIIKKLYSKDFFILDKNKKYNKNELRKSGLNKSKEIPSAVHIAAAISSYARIIINEYKNIPGNPCIMSDTDSVVLTKPLPDYLVGKELGKMKLEQEITEGIFLRKKLYYILNSKNEEVIKASGLDSSRLNYNYFERLLKGETIEIEKTSFNVDWKTLNISVLNSNIKIQGLIGKIKTIYNTKDVNYKFISFPVKYNVIIHPLYPLKDPILINNKQNISSSSLNNKDKLIIFIFLTTLLTTLLLLVYHIIII
jgi:hypothetical protein